MPLWKRLIRLVAIIVLCPVLLLLGCQSKLIYHPNPYREAYESMLRATKGVRLRFGTGQGAQMAFYIPPRAAAAGLPQAVWVCFAGNGSLALDWLNYTDKWDPGYAYLLVDYPGYGDCAGTPSPASIRENGTAAVAALAAHLHTTQAELQPRLAVLGHSLGSAASLMAADSLDLRRGVLLSPFTSMTEMGRIVLGWPLCHLNLHRFDNRRTLAHVAARQGARLVIFHGTEDEVIPVPMGRELAAAHPQAVTLHEVPGAHHNDIIGRAAPQIGQAMAQVLGASGH